MKKKNQHKGLQGEQKKPQQANQQTSDNQTHKDKDSSKKLPEDLDRNEGQERWQKG